MGIEALYRKPRLSKPHPGHKIYPYLLRGVEITRANQVWATDITYIPMAKGFCYLVAIMDWASRRVLAWRLSNTLNVSFCTMSLEELYNFHADSAREKRGRGKEEVIFFCALACFSCSLDGFSCFLIFSYAHVQVLCHLL